MSDAIATFFDAWGTADADARAAKIAQSTADTVQYSDPRSDGRLTGHAAVGDYVAMFSAGAPGWTARVVNADTVGGYTRAIIAFGGKGPDGSDMVQHGTYFCEEDGGKLTLIAGFVGLGSTE